MTEYLKRQIASTAGITSSRSAKTILPKGILITLEGVDLVGKTTHAKILRDNLAKCGYSVTSSREPGGTPLGEALRNLLKHSDSPSITPLAEALLFAASRAQLCETVVVPALEAKSVVVVDRFTDSSLAYQGYGKNLDLETVYKLNAIATFGVVPDLTFLLNSHAGALNSEFSRRSDDRFEREPVSFHDRVESGYSEIAKNSDRWVAVPRGEIQETADFILDRAIKRIELIRG